MGKCESVKMWKFGNGEVWKCENGEVGKYASVEMGKWGNIEMIYGNGHWRTWFLRAVMMLAEKMRVKETASSMRAANLRFST